jgi:hypothetical protein
MQLSESVATRLHDRGHQIVAQNDVVEDPLPALKKAMALRNLPKVAVRISEGHIGRTQPPRIDPAAQTEITMMLKEAGFTVIDGTDREIAAADVTYVVEGEAFSEFAARIATLVNCSARVELKMLKRGTNEVDYEDRQTTRAIDLSENVAGKTALQKAGRLLGIRLLQHFEKIIPAR